MTTTTRTRWAAIGAAIAVTLGAGGIGITHATTSSGAMPIFRVLDEPCRLADTRPAPDTVGPRTAGIGEGETYDLDGWGVVGNCDLPADTASLSLNVTAVGATQQTNLRFFPQGSPVPTAANLNPSPGASPTPNAVNVGLNETTGQFSVFNAFGTVAVIIDVIGYYDDHVHTGDDIVNGSLTAIDSRDEPGVAFANILASQAIPATPDVMIMTRLRVPVDGFVKIEVTGDWSNGAAGNDQAQCQLTEGTDGVDIAEPSFLLDDRDTDAAATSFSAHRIVEVEASTTPFVVIGSGTDFSLVCEQLVGSPFLSNLHLSATFFATSYEVNPPIVLAPCRAPPAGGGWAPPPRPPARDTSLREKHFDMTTRNGPPLQQLHRSKGTNMINTTRSRWAAIGAAVAVTLGAGGIGITHATTDSSEGPVSAFFPIEPCRLADNAAVTEDSSITLNGWGMTGDCDLPADITGLAANVTAVNATAQTNLRFYAEGDAVPETANLNPSPGAAPSPNAVNITLNDTNGQFQVYNRFGSVGVFIDIMGYYDNHTHDDRYYTESEVDSAVATKDNVEATWASDTNVDIGTGDTVVASVTLETPGAGFLIVNSSGYLTNSSANLITRCSITDGTSLDSAAFQLATVNTGEYEVISGTRGFTLNSIFGPVVTEYTVNLVCDTTSGTVDLFDPYLTAIFVPDPDASGIIIALDEDE